MACFSVIYFQIWKDSLTKLYNHEAFYEELEFRMKKFEENHEGFSQGRFFEEADQALYKAKATGKNRVCCNTK